MINIADFIYIDSSSFKAGIDEKELACLIDRLSYGKIKKEYIEASAAGCFREITPFHISKKLITFAEYREFVNATSYLTEAEKEGWGWIWKSGWKKEEGISWRRPFGDSSDSVYRDEADVFPVMQVSWNDAVAYTEWRSSAEDITVRIPSEIEWEIFAAKSGVKSLTEPVDDLNYSINDSKDYIELLRVKLMESVNNLGLLWEWTLDWYDSYSQDRVVKGFGEVYKVLRGGSLLSDEIQKRREFRFRRCPTARSPYYGFRIVFLK